MKMYRYGDIHLPTRINKILSTQTMPNVTIAKYQISSIPTAHSIYRSSFQRHSLSRFYFKN